MSLGSNLIMSLSSSISSVLFSASNWSSFNAGGPMALILFILMAGAQTIAMLLPQWIQKRKQKKVVRLGKNPAQNQQNKTMKIFTYVMLAMIILMGFSLASGMGIYWVVSALFSVAQTLITQAIVGRKKKEKKH